jgi:hypothetical protein
LIISSDPGEPKTTKEALSGPERELWKEAIKNEITNCMSRGAWKTSRKMVTEQMRRK